MLRQILQISWVSPQAIHTWCGFWFHARCQVLVQDFDWKPRSDIYQNSEGAGCKSNLSTGKPIGHVCKKCHDSDAENRTLSLPLFVKMLIQKKLKNLYSYLSQLASLHHHGTFFLNSHSQPIFS